jgi:hypothetical protein
MWCEDRERAGMRANSYVDIIIEKCLDIEYLRRRGGRAWSI